MPIPTVYGKLPFTTAEQVCVSSQFKRDNPMYGVVGADNIIYMFLNSERTAAKAYFEGLPSFTGWDELDSNTSMVRCETRLDYYLPNFFPELNVGDPGYPAPVSLHPGILNIGPFLVPMNLRGGDANGTVGSEATADDKIQFNGVTFGTQVNVGQFVMVIPAGTVVTVRVLNELNTDCWGNGYLSVYP